MAQAVLKDIAHWHRNEVKQVSQGQKFQNTKKSEVIMGAGRPRAIINWDDVDRLLIAGCSGVEVAASHGLNPATIYDRCEKDHGTSFSEYSQEKKAKGQSLIRVQQFEKALGRTTEDY